MMLYTNRPNSPHAKAFKQAKTITAFELTKMIVKVMGKKLSFAHYDPTIFYVNHMRPYGQSGYLEIKQNKDQTFTSIYRNKNGKLVRKEIQSLLRPAPDKDQ